MANGPRRRGRALRMAELMPRLDTQSGPKPDLDTTLHALVLWVSPYPLLHGCLGIFRSLGRAGVPVHAVVAGPHEPVASSRYLRGTTTWSTALDLDPAGFLEHLVDMGARFSRPPVVMCTSDDMAVLVAEHRAELDRHYLIAPVPPELPRRLTDKSQLQALCQGAGISTPDTIRVDEHGRVEEVAKSVAYPVVIKSTALRDQTSVDQMVTNSTLVTSGEQLTAIAEGRDEPLGMLVQEYLPDETSEDWIAHGYCGIDGSVKVVFTGRKVRSWPPRGGATAQAFTRENAELTRLTTAFCHSVGYRGIFDLDWRLDLRSDQYHLLDFNPRVGAQFRMFEDDAGVDVVRAMHLDLSGRDVPAGSVRDGRRFVVEPWYLASRIADRQAAQAPGGSGRWNMAWLAWDDLRPAAAMVVRQTVRSLSERVPQRGRRPRVPGQGVHHWP